MSATETNRQLGGTGPQRLFKYHPLFFTLQFEFKLVPRCCSVEAQLRHMDSEVWSERRNIIPGRLAIVLLFFFVHSLFLRQLKFSFHFHDLFNLLF